MSSRSGKKIDNEFYDRLGSRWYLAQNDPVALLRAESELRNPWVRDLIGKLSRPVAGAKASVLDIGCGAGFLTNDLARHGYRVTGLDLSKESLSVAREYDATGTVEYISGDASTLPFEAGTFDVVCAMDFLEHVEDPGRVIAEASRVLKPGGLFFFHTFNKNPIAGLVVIKGVELFVKNTPPHMHIYKLFIKPQAVRRMCEEVGLAVQELRGCRPVVGSLAFWKMLATGVVPKRFRFTWSRSTLISYSGYAVKGR